MQRLGLATLGQRNKRAVSSRCCLSSNAEFGGRSVGRLGGSLLVHLSIPSPPQLEMVGEGRAERELHCAFTAFVSQPNSSAWRAGYAGLKGKIKEFVGKILACAKAEKRGQRSTGEIALRPGMDWGGTRHGNPTAVALGPIWPMSLLVSMLPFRASFQSN